VIAALLLITQLAATFPAKPSPPSPAAPGSPAPLAPAVILARYAAALHTLKEPRVITFDYTLEQTGPRSISQTHRVFRSDNDERDETLSNDGRTLKQPLVRIFRGRRNRYTVARLAPRTDQYDFVFVGPRRNARHFDYVFRLTPKTLRPYTVTDVTIDGVRFLPLAIEFATGQNEGQGTVAFGSNARWWVPYAANARAVVADDTATERLTFYTYRFPPNLPGSTFTQARRLPAPLSYPLKSETPVIPHRAP
jgi:hypothetical protein